MSRTAQVFKNKIKANDVYGGLKINTIVTLL